jgi:diguanylate cyclase (GGDEF)-like protein
MRSVRILVVDDSGADAVLAMKALERGGFAVQYEVVDRLEAARDALQSGPWDAVVSDFNLPGFTGLQVLEELRRTGMDIPFILISGAIGEETAVAAMKAGASDYLMKDRLERLAPALGRALQEAELRAEHRRMRRELEESQARLRRLTRVYAVLSGINGIIVRVRDRNELFREACRIAVESGQLPMAWIGLVDRAAGRIQPRAWHGKNEAYLREMPLTLDAEDRANYGLAGRAVNDGAAVVANDIGRDPRAPRGASAVEHGIRSYVVLPLHNAHEVVGVLGLGAGETGFFDDEEMKLLLELGGDISFALEHIEKTNRLDYLAYYDSLTELPNRTLFHERLQQAVTAAGREDRKLAVIVHDIERFKTINDTFGRQVGDDLLRQVADRLRGAATGASELGRIAADQFAIWVPAVASEEDLARSAQQQAESVFAQPFRLGDKELAANTRFGIAVYPADGADADALLANAESALKKAKSAGDRYLFYTQRMSDRVGEKLALETELRRALERGQFVLHYQPKVDLQSRRIVGLEALLRWQSPERSLVPPLEFIPLLEQSGLILEVGAWALRQAAQDHRRWAERSLAAPRIAVNVSPIQLRQRDFVRVVEGAIEPAPGAIDLEITESLIMADVQDSIEKLGALRALGVDIAIDDFGTGYSSLAYLSRLPVATLKIDRSFVDDFASPASTSLVSTIISLGRALGLKLVAEGVETEEQARLLWLLKCDQAQGYLFSRPLPFEAMGALLDAESGVAAPG